MAQKNPRPGANPYVGPRAFITGETLYGRSREGAELLDLLIAERIALLHSPSGAGKSSLVNASVIPQMREQGFWTLRTARVNIDPPAGWADRPGFNRYVLSVLRSFEAEFPTRQQHSLEELAGMTLPQYMQSYPARGAQHLKDFDPHASLFIVFDQFEELVRLDAVDRDAKLEFFSQAGEALRDRNLWALFVLREDYLAAIEPFTRPIPNRLSVTYRLDFLDARSAIEAIQNPAHDSGVDFEDAAAVRLVDDLRRIRVQQTDGTALEQLGLYVEPVQLQVVCRRLWGALGGRKVLTVEDVAKAGNIDDALGDYYAFHIGSVAATSGVSERQVREWFDRKLITVKGIRGQVLMEPEASGGLPNRAIKLLQEAYLIRADKRGNATWFELSHDRLTRPIRRNNAAWFIDNLNVFQRQADLWNNQGRPDSLLLRGDAYVDAAEWAKAHADSLQPAEQEFLEACRAGYQNNQRERRTNQLIRWAALLMAVLTVAAIYFFYQAQAEAERATRQEAIANQEAERANRQEDRAREQEAIAREQEALARQKEQMANVNLQIAQVRELAAKSVSSLAVDPELSIRLALQAIQGVDLTQPEMESSINQVEDALRQALPALRAEHVLRDPLLSGAESFSHAGAAWSVSFSPSGQRVASVGLDGSLKVWDTITGRLLKTVSVLAPAPDHFGATSAAFSPNGRQLAVATGDGRVLLFDSSTWEQVDARQMQAGPIWGLAFSPDGALLISSGQEGAQVWNLSDQTVQFLLDGHNGEVGAVAFSPDGTRIATAGADGLVILWDAGTRRPLQRLAGHTGQVSSLAFSPDGKRLATAGEDRTILLWDISLPAVPQALAINGHRDWIHAVAFTRDGASLISASADRTVRLWDTTYGRPGLVLLGHQDQVYGLAVSPDGKRIATAGQDHTARVWNISPEGSRELVTFDHHAPVYAIAVSPDGGKLVSAGGDHLLRVWDVVLRRMTTALAGHSDIVEGVAFSPDGTRIVSASRDGTARIWDAAAGGELFVFRGNGGPLSAVQFSPDGQRVASGGADGLIKIWDVATGAVLLDLPSEWGALHALEFSPHGLLLAAGYEEHIVALWDARDGALLSVLDGHTDVVRTVTFDPNSQWLASSGDDGSIILWDMDPARWGQSQAAMRGRGDTIFSLAFNADGKFLYSGGADGIGILWNLEDRTTEFQTYGHTDQVYAVAFHPNGQHLYSAGRDGTLRTFVFGLEELLTLAGQRTTREFSEEECREYLNAACPSDSGAQPASPPSPALVQLRTPSDMPAVPGSQMSDADSSTFASELRAPGGDDFDINLFERPFNGGEMNIYYPDVDIIRAAAAEDRTWLYFGITLAGPRGDGLYGNYGIELDLDVDGRGDYFISTLTPGREWSTSGVRIWFDRNGDVGNSLPYVSDLPKVGDGYEALLFDQGNGDAPDLAWARIDPLDPNRVQIALMRSVIAGDPVYAWLAWAGRDPFKPAWFDYNDYFTFEQAGSPLKTLPRYYPLKDLAGVDNTCRAPVGFTAFGQAVYCQSDRARNDN
ncbi:MAG: hypothetical protein ACOY0R_07575 [Chloroflexota bacterium]